MKFGEAIKALKVGEKVARSGWNGKGMFLKYVSGDEWSLKIPIIQGELVPLLPFIGMKTADNCFVPWLASQSDMLADDWVIVHA